MTVRRAEPADAGAIADVHVRTWQAAYRHAFPAEVLENLSVDEHETRWRPRLEEGLIAWIAPAEGRIERLRLGRAVPHRGGHGRAVRDLIDTVRGVEVEEALYRLALVGG